eukprot:557956-Amorphochlora_amoeboformis.AAC.2
MNKLSARVNKQPQHNRRYSTNTTVSTLFQQTLAPLPNQYNSNGRQPRRYIGDIVINFRSSLDYRALNSGYSGSSAVSGFSGDPGDPALVRSGSPPRSASVVLVLDLGVKLGLDLSFRVV